MAKNDTIILDSILDERIRMKLPSEKRDESFEFLAVEQILKDMSLSKDDILAGIVDGRNDGGIDAMYIFVNGLLLSNVNSLNWPRTNIELEVQIVTCKHHETFKQAPLDNIIATLSEIFDFKISYEQLRGKYNSELLRLRDLLKNAYKKLASKISLFNINISYASRGDTTSIGESIISRGEQIISVCENLFNDCKTAMLYFGSTELVKLYRKVPNFSLELRYHSVLGKGERYVLLCSLTCYNKFITDSAGKLRRYLFDSNVRDFMGLNRVNEDIKETLLDDNSPDFWWLNNGITILATSAQVIGDFIHLEDIQIVNGLQTTESIYKYFSADEKDKNDRSLLVKVIVSKDPDIRDSIIRATNNQTNVELSALHATDKIQRDIEDILFRNKIYYERRVNYYFNQGIHPSAIITPLYLASGYLSLILKNLLQAPQLKSRFMRDPIKYERIFSEKVSINVWPSIAIILKKTDSFLTKSRNARKGITDKYLKRWRHITAFITVSRLIGKFDFNANDLIDLNILTFSDQELEKTWAFLQSRYVDLDNKLLSQGEAFSLIKFAESEYNIVGIDRMFANLGRTARGITNDLAACHSQLQVEDPKLFLEQVYQNLDFNKGVSISKKEVAMKLKCSLSAVNLALRIIKYEKLIGNTNFD